MKEKLGNFNAFVYANLYDENGYFLGKCPDTPNAIKEAVKKDVRISFLQVKYPGFATETRFV